MVWKKKKQKSGGVDDLTKIIGVDDQHVSQLRSCMKGSDGSVVSSDEDISMDGSKSSQINSSSVRSRSSTSKRSHSSRSGDTQSKASVAGSERSRPEHGPEPGPEPGPGNRSKESVDEIGDDGGGTGMTAQPPSVMSKSHSLDPLGQPSKNKDSLDKKSVRFSHIQIREFERVVSDNPSCTSGPPIGIGWKHGRTHIVDVNSYERIRQIRKKPSRLILSREEREALLLNWGASFHDIVEAVRGNLKVKNQRRQTVVNIGKIERIEEAFESATRKLKRALLLRRSTGDKVKRLQEQANLAQSALTSLKIAEDRALCEIRASRIIAPQRIEKVVVDDYSDGNAVGVTTFSKSGPIKAQIRTSQRSMGVKQRSEMSSSFDTLDHSTTPSQKELERFYYELELEMFGDEEIPSMVGQTLEITVSRSNYFDRAESRLSIGTLNLDDSMKNGTANGSSDQTTEADTTSSAVKAVEKGEEIDDEIDAALEKEMDRSMISQSLLDDIELEDDECATDSQEVFHHHHHLPLQRMHPVHIDYISSRYHTANSRLSSSLDSADPERGRLTESVIAVEYEFGGSGRPQQQQYTEPQPPPPSIPPPLHAGMSMFQDCALLGSQNEFSIDLTSPSSGMGRRKSRSSSRRDDYAGPKVRHVPLLSHRSPTQWMDEEVDSENTPGAFTGCYDTITISEDTFDRSSLYGNTNDYYQDQIARRRKYQVIY
jgi:hypothetical protein